MVAPQEKAFCKIVVVVYHVSIVAKGKGYGNMYIVYWLCALCQIHFYTWIRIRIQNYWVSYLDPNLDKWLDPNTDLDQVFFSKGLDSVRLKPDLKTLLQSNEGKVNGGHPFFGTFFIASKKSFLPPPPLS